MPPLLRASSAERWASCPASVTLQRPSDALQTPGMAARRGTVAHGALADALYQWTVSRDMPLLDTVLAATKLIGRPAQELRGLGENPDVTGMVVGKAEAGKAATLLAWLALEYGEDVTSKQLTLLSEFDITPGWDVLGYGIGGTADVVVIDRKRMMLRVIDLKTGAHPVPADAWQLRVYLAGAWMIVANKLDWRNTSGQTVVFQNGEPKLSPLYGEKEISEWVRTLLDAAEKIRQNSTLTSPGDICTYCPAKVRCPAVAEIFGIQRDPFEGIPPPT